MDILDALQEINPQPIEPPRVTVEDGMDSISDGVFSAYLAKAGVPEETIEWRLLEDVNLREEVISMYENNNINTNVNGL